MEPHYLGNMDLLTLRKVGFLASRKVVPLILNLERTLFIRHQNGCLTKNCY